MSFACIAWEAKKGMPKDNLESILRLRIASEIYIAINMND